METHLNPLIKKQQPRTFTPPRHHWWIGIAVLLTAASTVLWWNLRAGKNHVVSPSASEGQQSAPPVHVSIRRIVSTTSPQWLEVTGTVQAELEAPIASKVMGRVQNVLVREGERVRRGQTLAVLDARDLDASVAQANASLRSSDVGYISAQVSASRSATTGGARSVPPRTRSASPRSPR